MESQQVHFNETELKQVLFSAALMSTVERDGDERDWVIIESFAEGYWKPDYGDYTQFQKRMFNEISELLMDEVALYETIDTLISDFGISYNQDQKRIILGLLGYLFAADGISQMEKSN